jgi:hypothetical protein
MAQVKPSDSPYGKLLTIFSENQFFNSASKLEELKTTGWDVVRKMMFCGSISLASELQGV